MLEFRCRSHGPFDRLLDRRDSDEEKAHQDCPKCEESSPRMLSAVRGTVRISEVRMGKSQPCPDNVLDTEPLGDGMPYDEWSAMQDAKDERILDGVGD